MSRFFPLPLLSSLKFVAAVFAVGLIQRNVSHAIAKSFYGSPALFHWDGIDLLERQFARRMRGPPHWASTAGVARVARSTICPPHGNRVVEGMVEFVQVVWTSVACLCIQGLASGYGPFLDKPLADLHIAIELFKAWMVLFSALPGFCDCLLNHGYALLQRLQRAEGRLAGNMRDSFGAQARSWLRLE